MPTPPKSGEAVRRRLGHSLAFKLILPGVAATAFSCLVLSMIASSQARRNLGGAFESKGQAIALALATTAEQAVGGNASTLQGQIDSYRLISDVSYVYVQDGNGAILVHTFSPQFPSGIERLNPFTGEQGERVQVAPGLEFVTPSGTIRAIDIAAPIAGGALGVVHVGMDRVRIDRAVASLRRQLLLWGVLVALAGGLLALPVPLLLVVRRVGRLTRVTQEIVRRGDLTLPIDAGGQDELAELADAFRSMVEKLGTVIGGLKQSAGALDLSAGQLKQSADEQSQTVSRQAAALQETQVTAQEIKQTSQLAAAKAESVLHAAARAEQFSTAGEAAIERTLTGLTDIRFHVDQIAGKIGELSEGTRQVAGITETVKDLADQSNMLALNAAIEAVRSGEHGKGFAVVAREIRSLADQSIASTRRVGEVLGDIGRRVREVVAITQAGAQRIEAGLEQVRSSGESLRELSGIVRDSSSSARQIAAAVEQQNAGIGQIFSAVSDLSRMMDETVKRLEDTNTAVENLGSLSNRAASMVKGYSV